MQSHVSLKEGSRGRFYCTQRTKTCEDRAEREWRIVALKIGVMWLETRQTGCYLKLEEARNRFALPAFGRSRVLQTLCFWSSKTGF